MEPEHIQSALTLQYTQMWKPGIEIPDVFRFLESHPEISPSEKIDILLIDQHHRWKTGNILTVEHYIRRVPELASDKSLLLKLIKDQFGYLEKLSQIDVKEFIKRFPDHEEDLHAILSKTREEDAKE